MSLYTCLYAGHSSPSLRTVGRKPDGAYSRSVSGISDQRLAGPEQQHQQDTQHTHHGKHRLIQNDLDDAGPEPGRNALHPGPKRLLAGLVNIVPELTEPSEPQGLIGDPARAVIDHENKSAGQQQQPYKSEKTADHASPYVARARKRSQPLAAQRRKFNLISALSAPFDRASGRRRVRKALTLQGAPSIRPPMAADAIPPPLFCGRRHHVSDLCSENGILRNTRKYTSVDHAVERPARSSLSTRDRHCRRIFETWPTPPLPRRRRARLPAAPLSTSRVAPRCAARSALSKRRSRAATAMRR